MKVPTLITNRTSAPTTPLAAPSGRGATAEAFGFSIGQGLNALAGAVREQAVQQQRFNALQAFNDFSTQTSQMLFEAKRQAAVNPVGFADGFMAQYAARESEFLANLPGSVRDEFSVRTGQMRESLTANSLEFQFQQTDTFFKQGIEDAYTKARQELGQGGTSEDLDLYRARVDEVINAAGITEAEKRAIRRNAYAGMEAVVYKNEQIKRLMEDSEGGPAREQAMQLLEITGGGSPTELEGAAELGEQLALQGVGSIDAWAALPTRARAALIAVAADYNGLPDSVAVAARSGDLESIAEAIRDLPTPGAKDMSDLVKDARATLDDDPRFANVAYEDRIALLADAEREVAAIRTEATRQQNAINDSKVNALHVALFDGEAGQMEIDQAREAGWLTDIQDIEKAQKLLEDRDEGLVLAQQAQFKLAANQTFDPNSDDDRKQLNAWVGKAGLEAVERRDSEYFTQSLVPAVRRAQDIPTDVVGKLVGMMRNTDAIKARWALDALSQLRQASPAAFAHRLTEADEATVSFWNERKDMYTDEQLMSMVRGGLTPEDRRINAELRKEAKELFNKPDLGLSQVALKTFDNWGLPATPMGTQSALLDDFRVLFEDEYAKSFGDLEGAKARASERLKKYWAVTDIGGKKSLMRDAPEVSGYMPVDGSFKWIEEQVQQELGIKLPLGFNLNLLEGAEQNAAWEADGRRAVQSFQLFSDEQTREEAARNKFGGEPPSYLVIITEADGTSRIAMDEPQPGLSANLRGQVLPKRLYFEVTPELRMQQEEVFQKKRAEIEAKLDDKGLAGALRHSYETGIPIPQEILEKSFPQVGLGVLDPAVAADAEVLPNVPPEQVRNFLFGDPAAPKAGIQTGAYTLPEIK